ncbi:hypothetical protein C8J56DRAFT_1037570 [Mycena floridula]|nr:hypothetical protein C8J56DRAFT_1037570 [Mycena floridula]
MGKQLPHRTSDQNIPPVEISSSDSSIPHASSFLQDIPSFSAPEGHSFSDRRFNSDGNRTFGQEPNEGPQTDQSSGSSTARTMHGSRTEYASRAAGSYASTPFSQTQHQSEQSDGIMREIAKKRSANLMGDVPFSFPSSKSKPGDGAPASTPAAHTSNERFNPAAKAQKDTFLNHLGREKGRGKAKTGSKSKATSGPTSSKTKSIRMYEWNFGVIEDTKALDSGRYRRPSNSKARRAVLKLGSLAADSQARN